MEVSGKVIKIINEYKIVVNLGWDSVSVGDTLHVVDNSVEVTDLDTHEFLGTYTFKKEKMIVDEVFEKFSICTPSRTKKVQNSLMAAMNPLMNTPQVVEIPFNVENDENEKIYLNEKNIKIGDTVISN